MAATANRLARFARSMQDIPAANVALLNQLRQTGYKLGLVSNADAGEIHGWATSPIRMFFDSTVFSCNVGMMKPEPQIFHYCLGELQLQPQDCLFVGDGGADELKAARQLGFTTVMVAGIIRELWPDTIEPRAKDADFIIEEPAELWMDRKQ
jgi:putative hydrolase of the HAD superfamily